MSFFPHNCLHCKSTSSTCMASGKINFTQHIYIDIGTGMTPNSDWFNLSKSVTVAWPNSHLARLSIKLADWSLLKITGNCFNVFLNVAREISQVHVGCRKCRFLWSKEKATQRSNLDQKFALTTLSYTILSSGKWTTVGFRDPFDQSEPSDSAVTIF